MNVGYYWRFGLASIVVLFLSATLSASVGGSISGMVKDSSGAVIPGATVTAKNVDTGVAQKAMTDSNGSYAFPMIAIGHYDVEVSHPGFKPCLRHDVTVDANSASFIDTTLTVGEHNEEVTVDDSAAHVETNGSQMGDLITAAEMTSVPLNGRSYTDLLTLQPGVAPASSITSNTVQDVGASALSPSGDLNPGTISINGQREFANAFIVNGSDAEEDVNMGTAIIPNLDSIAEFRILTNNFDAEYGEFSGGQINVITKSGTNSFHGDLFEFLRNTDLDARNYFSPQRATFIQNQFGGTIGGPIKRNKIFFFADYQGTRQRQGVDTGDIPVPSLQDRSGNLSDLASSFTTVNAESMSVPTTVTGAGWASTLSQRLGYQVSAGEPYYFHGCVGNTQCVLPNAVIPAAAFSGPAQHLLQYIPSPDVPGTEFSTSAYNQALRDDKGALRIDANTAWGMLAAYYFVDDYSLDNPYPVAQGGASVPGFDALSVGRAQLLSLGDTKTLGSMAVNEFRFSFMRSANTLGEPEGGVGVSLASQGFVDSAGNPTIVPLAPENEGVENIVFNNFSIGTNTNELKQENDTYQWLDNFSKIAGRHTLKIGGEFHFDQVNVNPIAQFNGSFLFSGSETGSDFADFLLGIPSQYNQSQLNPFYGRNKYTGFFAQDSWHLKSNLTLNYGLRFDRIEPWYEKYNQISTTEPGKQSVVFPTAPAGILFPTDPGVPRTLAPPGDEFSPRIGLAYSPNVTSGGLARKLLGGPGKTSVRAGFGLYYTSIEALTIGVLAANAPYGTTYSSPGPPLFSDPFVTASTGRNLGQYFPVSLAPLNVSRSHPDANVNWSQYTPISGIPAYPTTNRIPYTEEYMLSLEREVGNKTLLSASYVGTEAHRLLVLVESNPGNPALCLSTPGCGPFNEGATRGPLGPNFGSDTNQSTTGNSNYNALEVSVRHTTGPFEIFASYTFSKSMDQSSNVGEEVNPIDPALSYALSAFDIKHNFVVSYSHQLPVAWMFRTSGRWTQSWTLSGITHFSSGFPVTLLNYGDNSLLGSAPNGINNYGVDEPQYTAGPLNLNADPRDGNSYFNTSLFGLQPLGTPGNAKRRFFFGPGSDNYDAALAKSFLLTESKSLELRGEAFNVFNHAQFFGPTSVDGNISSSTFGHVVSAAAPRLMQVALKYNF